MVDTTLADNLAAFAESAGKEVAALEAGVAASRTEYRALLAHYAQVREGYDI